MKPAPSNPENKPRNKSLFGSCIYKQGVTELEFLFRVGQMGLLNIFSGFWDFLYY